jgi:glycosyltransferase involved in cell wall biosynthesis
MKVLISHPTGNANVRAAALGFMEANLLNRFYTSIASFPGSLLNRMGKWVPLSEINRRHYNALLQPITRMWPWLELGRLAASRAGLSQLTAHEKGYFCLDAVYHSLDKKVASSLRHCLKDGTEVIYSYEDGALFSFREAKRLGLLCFYDLPIGYWRSAQRLLQQERERWPEWADTLTGFHDSEIKLNIKDEELCLADKIFVASQFTAATLKEYHGHLAPVEIIPYGFPPVYENRKYPAIANRPLKLLFVGSLSQRKGLADLLAVADRLKEKVQLTLVGQKVTNKCEPLNAALHKHRWISSTSHDNVLALMREHDVLVFPSLFEGFGLVITEAMSQGTPVVTTDRTAGPDIIRDGENGWIIEAGSTESLQLAIEKILSNSAVIKKVGTAAMETARRRPWNVYGAELAAAIKNHFRSGC